MTIRATPRQPTDLKDDAQATSEVGGLIGILDTRVSDGISEISCHPGFFAADLASSYSIEREFEIRTLRDPIVRQAILAFGVVLVSFTDVGRLLHGPTRSV
jgi:predicted glycoside hydrolase/deacetylase ChbG (UPF0249 family)